MCRYDEVRVPPEPKSVPAARSFLHDRLAVWGLLAQLDDAGLVVSELVTNAVVHGQPPVVLVLSWAGGVVEMAVRDASTDEPVARPVRTDLDQDLADVLAVEAALPAGLLEDRDPRVDIGAAGSVAGGRGLLLVQELAGNWGTTAGPGGGKTVWARMPPARPANECCCDTGQGTAIRVLASGHQAEDCAR